jgi:hypothetical protein
MHAVTITTPRIIGTITIQQPLLGPKIEPPVRDDRMRFDVIGDEFAHHIHTICQGVQSIMRTPALEMAADVTAKIFRAREGEEIVFEYPSPLARMTDGSPMTIRLKDAYNPMGFTPDQKWAANLDFISEKTGFPSRYTSQRLAAKVFASLIEKCGETVEFKVNPERMRFQPRASLMALPALAA